MPQFTNWAGNHRCRPTEIHAPGSEAEVAELVDAVRDRDSTLKIAGAGHSWSDIACTDGELAHLDTLDELVEIDRQAGTVCVQAGIRLRDLIARLAERGLALPNLGSIGEQSIAGVISTGTHGTGLETGNLSSMVRSLRLVDGRGETVEVSRESDEDLFAAARVGLGALGVITQVTIDCVPAFRLRERAWTLPFDEAIAGMADLVETHDHVKFWWLPHTDVVEVFVADRTERRATPPDLLQRVDDAGLLRPVFAGVLETGARYPTVIPLLNRLVAATYFNDYERVADSHEVFNVAMPPKHLEAEYGFPVEAAEEALERMRRRIRMDRHRVNFITEVRFVAADDIWLSPAYERDSCQIGAYIGETPGWRDYFEAFEAIADRLDARPHWGKCFFADTARLSAVYPRLEDFDTLRRRHDPDGIFENAFIERVFG